MKCPAMKAIVYERYGGPDVLQIKSLSKPVPKNNEILIKIKATTVSRGDIRMRSFSVPMIQWLPARLYLGLFHPRRKVLGMEISGVVEEIGSDVKRFKVGDVVLASTFEVGFGGYAEYKTIPETGLVAIKPEWLTYGEAAASIGAGVAAIRCLRKANITNGQNVLIYGASGAVGSCAVQIAKNEYKAIVTAVCSTKNQDMVKNLGADFVVDYLKEDLTQRSQKYHVIFDAVSKLSKTKALKVLEPNGVYLDVHKDTNSGSMRDDFQFLLKMLEEKKLKPYIDRVYEMHQVVEAHRYVDEGHKRGNVVLQIDA